MKFSIHTLGCKVNQYDSEEISENLIRHGFTPSDDGGAGVYIVNSCTVTAESDRKTRQLVRKLKRQNPSAAVVLTGCMPQAFPSLGEDLAEADIVIGNRSNADIPALIDEFLRDGKRIFRVVPHGRTDCYAGGMIGGFEGHTRAFVKIQDGCDRYCSYCAIPYARGFSRSKPLGVIKQELLGIAAAGYREVVFVGINLSAYGKDTGRTMADAVRLAQETAGIARIRLGSLEPDHITPAVLSELAGFGKFCPQFHISLQSGCDRVLKRMNRHYTAVEYEALCGNIRRVFPDAAITTDIICGFPGETEEDFLETLAFAEKMMFDKTHIFPYSRRPGTPADKMPGQVAKQVKEERCARLGAVCEKSRRDFMLSLVGRTVNVLFEAPDGSVQKGYAENYLPVRVVYGECLTGKILPVRVTGTDGDCLTGEIIT